jgi:hypothetical protein
MRVFLLLLALPFLATFAPESLARPPVAPPVLRLYAEPVPLREGGGDRLGALRFLEGWWLRSNDPRFGGLSAMHVENGGVTALNDGGRLYLFGVPRGRGVAPLASLWLPTGRAEDKHLRDSEALAIAGRTAWVSYERHNSLRSFALPTWQRLRTLSPAVMRSWPKNAGAEAMLRLPDGRFLIFAEGHRDDRGLTRAALFDGDPTDPGTRATELGYRPPDGYRVTDAALLPDGRILFLNRRVSLWDGMQVKMTLADKPELRPGSVIAGREIAHFGPDVTTDNYEAISVGREGGRTIVWIASDDNYMSFQRTLLMKFALEL